MSLLFDFSVDKASNTIHITREFAAELDLVWDAFTKAEILEQWVVLKPWRAQTKEMDFREGGRWLYAMVSSENDYHWNLVEFIKIQPRSGFSTKDSFCDENGNPINDPFSWVNNSFKAGKDITTVYIEKKFDNLSTLEMMLSGGLSEGLSKALANLDEILHTLKNKKK
jgi:uncharacterized protein YndB with AHSA1/START domain